MDIRITNLAEYIDSIPLVAMWLYGESGYAQSGRTLDDMIADLAIRCHADTLPMTLVGLAGGRVVGTVTLTADELNGRTAYAPWITLLYVAEDARGLGFGTELLRAAADRARRLGHREVYLHTAKQREFYERLGWQLIEELDGDGTREAIMKLSLDP